MANWKGFVSARQGYRRLQHILSLVPAPDPRLSLPAPTSSLMLQDIYVGPPGSQLPIVQGVAFQMQAGQGLGVIGPAPRASRRWRAPSSASGRPCAARSASTAPTLDQWEADELGRHIGYLPQDVELFDGSVAENIARFRPEPDAEAVIAAAKTAGAHEHDPAAARRLRHPDRRGRRRSSPAASASASRSPGRSSAIPSSSSSTSRTPTSTATATRR